ncbi:MAG: FecR family protein, partial [Pontimonas sp.]
MIERQSGDTLTSTTGLEIESYDTVKTQQGRTSIIFVDDTRVDVTENSKLVIDEFIYDPNTKTGALSLKTGIGTVRYASGQIAKNSRQNIKISTPTAVIAVRGTDFSMTVDETGSSTIILLPSCTIIANERVCVVGEIQVDSDVGTVIMNKAFQATVVDTAKSTPLKPLLLKLDESFINNLLIITPPKQIDDEKNRDAIKAVANILDLDLLVFEELNRDYLAEGEADRWQTDLDFDPLAGDFLFDALDQSMDNLVREARTDLDRKESNPKLGFDAETGVTILNQDPRWIYIREGASGNYVRMELQQGY